MITTYAVLSDIHGNSWALNAVLQDIKNRGIKNIFNLGDIFYGPLDPRGTFDLLRDLPIISVSGNQDRMLLEQQDDEDANPTLKFMLSELNDEHLQWIEKLPATKQIDDLFFLCHGTPKKDDAYLLEYVEQNTVKFKSQQELEQMIGSLPVEIILCGHSHVPNTALLPSGKFILNAGSVGLPAYIDDLPEFHTMETGSPFACYTIIERDKNSWKFHTIKLPYDWHKAAETAKKNGRSDWAYWLTTGRA